MRRLGALVLGMALFSLVAGCGIPEEDYLKSQKELADTQTALQAESTKLEQCQQSLKTCEDDAKEAQGALVALGAEHEKLGQEHSSLGADYSHLKALLAKIKTANETRQKAMDELLSKFQALIKSGKLSIEVNDGRMVINLPSNVLFAVGKSRLSKDGKAAVKEVAEVLKTIDGRKFQIAGHTDDQRGKRGFNPNWSLSYMRARSVFDIVVKAGMDESRLSLAAYAEYSPVADNTTPEGQERNRRIEIVLLPTSDELPLQQLMKIEKIEKKIETEIEK